MISFLVALCIIQTLLIIVVLIILKNNRKTFKTETIELNGFVITVKNSQLSINPKK